MNVFLRSIYGKQGIISIHAANKQGCVFLMDIWDCTFVQAGVWQQNMVIF